MLRATWMTSEHSCGGSLCLYDDATQGSAPYWRLTISWLPPDGHAGQDLCCHFSVASNASSHCVSAYQIPSSCLDYFLYINLHPFAICIGFVCPSRLPYICHIGFVYTQLPLYLHQTTYICISFVYIIIFHISTLHTFLTLDIWLTDSPHLHNICHDKSILIWRSSFSVSYYVNLPSPVNLRPGYSYFSAAIFSHVHTFSTYSIQK